MGVPEIVPSVRERLNPGGNVPLYRYHTGEPAEVSASCESVSLYSVPSIPGLKRASVVIVKSASLTMRVNSFSPVKLPSAALSVNVNSPDSEGVPEIMALPFCAESFKPSGSVPPGRVHLAFAALDVNAEYASISAEYDLLSTASGSSSVEIISPDGAMYSVKSLTARYVLLPDVRVTLTVKLNNPETVGVPDKYPRVSLA